MLGSASSRTAIGEIAGRGVGNIPFEDGLSEINLLLAPLSSLCLESFLRLEWCFCNTLDIFFMAALRSSCTPRCVPARHGHTTDHSLKSNFASAMLETEMTQRCKQNRTHMCVM